MMKWKCNAIQRLISGYIDDTLAEREAARVETHLRSCRVCQHEVATLKKTRALVLDFYVAPEVPESYYHQFEVKLHQAIERMPPISLGHRLKISIARCTWGLLTQCHQRFDRYIRGSRYALPRYALLLTLAVIIAVPFILKQERQPMSTYPRDVDNSMREAVLADNSVEAKLRNRGYNESSVRRKPPTEVSSPSLAANTREVGYWELIAPLTAEAAKALRKNGMVSQQDTHTNRRVDLATLNWQLGAGGQLTKSSMDLDIGSKKPLLQESRYAASPLEPQVTLFEVYQRKRRSVSHFFNFKKLMDVPSEILAIPEVPIKL